LFAPILRDGPRPVRLRVPQLAAAAHSLPTRPASQVRGQVAQVSSGRTVKNMQQLTRSRVGGGAFRSSGRGLIAPQGPIERPGTVRSYET